jgi:RimJ/RimL family protein N-acetyltransferase
MNDYYNNEIITIRRLEKSDKKNYRDLAIKLSFNPKMYEDEMLYDFAWSLALNRDGETHYSIFSTVNDLYIGDLLLKESDNDLPEIGINILPEYQNQKWGYNAIKAFTEYLKNRNDINRFIVRIYSDNEASKALFRKFNVKKIGTEDSTYVAFMKEANAILGEESTAYSDESIKDLESKVHIDKYVLEI